MEEKRVYKPFIVIDTHNQLYNKYATSLKNKGYVVKCLNPLNPKGSNHYNFMDYIRDEKDIEKLAERLMETTDETYDENDDSLYEDRLIVIKKVDTVLIEALIAYIHFHRIHSEQSIQEVCKLLDIAKNKNTQGTSELDEIFTKIKQYGYEDYAVEKYDEFRERASEWDEYIKSVTACANRLSVYMKENITQITTTDDVELDKFTDKQTVLFVVAPFDDDNFNSVMQILQMQLGEGSVPAND